MPSPRPIPLSNRSATWRRGSNIGTWPGAPIGQTDFVLPRNGPHKCRSRPTASEHISSACRSERARRTAKAHAAAGNPSPTIRELLENRLPAASQGRQQEFIFSADELLDERVSSEPDLAAKYDRTAAKFSEARRAALDNTRYYLSMLSDLDVYVATSMRTRQDFRSMADTCDRIFADERLRQMNLRYFDPTLSAAGGHEDKGLIECHMVKCAKLLVYCAGDKESYGKAPKPRWPSV